MAQNTALQELIERIDFDYVEGENVAIDSIRRQALSLLTKERKDIISCWENGKTIGCVIGSNDYTNETEQDNGQYYFTKNFNQ